MDNNMREHEKRFFFDFLPYTIHVQHDLESADQQLHANPRAQFLRLLISRNKITDDFKNSDAEHQILPIKIFV
jgi:hypothetical protein